jgi:flagellar motor switch protein FliN/FliY
MTSDMLSQDEIDALLKKSGSEDDADSGSSLEDYISAIEQDALGEIGNITFGSASTALSTLLSQKVDITTPTLSIVRKADLKDEFPEPHVAIHVNYTEGFQGMNLLVVKTEDAQIIADLMLGGDGTSPDEELSEMHVSAVQEAMNQMMGSAATSMSTLFNRKVDISPPGIDVIDPQKNELDDEITDEDILVKVSFRIKVGDLIDSSIMQVLSISFAKEMVQLLMNPGAQEEQSQQQAQEIPQPSTQAPQADMPTNRQQQPPPPPQQQQQQPMYQQPPQEQGQYGQSAMNRSANVQPVQFSNFDEGSSSNIEAKNLGMLLDIPLQVTVELGRTKRLIKDILELSPGSILELDKLAGEPVDILVNNKLVAKGEVVVIEENFGVRVTDILSQWDRLQKLQ